MKTFSVVVFLGLSAFVYQSAVLVRFYKQLSSTPEVVVDNMPSKYFRGYNGIDITSDVPLSNNDNASDKAKSPALIDDEAPPSSINDNERTTIAEMKSDVLSSSNNDNERTAIAAANTANEGVAVTGDDDHGHPSRDTDDDKKLEDKSILILMSVSIKEEDDIANEIRRINEDYYTVCGFHLKECKWEINVVPTSQELLHSFNEASSAMPLDNIRCHVNVFDGTYNKFAFLRTTPGLIEKMNSFDLVLFKDDDQRINSLDWRTFIEKRSNAVISAPLRRDSECSETRQWYQLHRTCHYESAPLGVPEWARRMYKNVIPIEVPFLEMYFVLMDGAFANYFFDQIFLMPEYVKQSSSWGPDIMWCAAANSWAGNDKSDVKYHPRRPGCNLIPLVSKHEDSRKMVKGDAFGDAGHQMLKKFEELPLLKKWMRGCGKWRDIVGGHNLHEIEEECRDFLGIVDSDPFDLGVCSKRIIADLGFYADGDDKATKSEELVGPPPPKEDNVKDGKENTTPASADDSALH